MKMIFKEKILKEILSDSMFKRKDLTLLEEEAIMLSLEVKFC